MRRIVTSKYRVRILQNKALLLSLLIIQGKTRSVLEKIVFDTLKNNSFNSVIYDKII